MKRLHFAVGLFAALACSGLQAQTSMRANIPFEFQMGKTTFPAGDYEFKYSSHLLVVRQELGDHTTAMVVTLGASRLKPPETGIVEFNRYGGSYFLAKIWTPGSPDGGALPKTSREKELARGATPIQTEAIVLQSK
jgi:hypothetical protein